MSEIQRRRLSQQELFSLYDLAQNTRNNIGNVFFDDIGPSTLPGVSEKAANVIISAFDVVGRRIIHAHKEGDEQATFLLKLLLDFYNQGVWLEERIDSVDEFVDSEEMKFTILNVGVVAFNRPKKPFYDPDGDGFKLSPDEERFVDGCTFMDVLMGVLSYSENSIA